MPNTPLMVGCGMTALALGPGTLPGDETLALQLFSAGGKVIILPESLLDAVTALSGSGPAYVFYLAEALEKAAAELGLADHARLLVSQTILGAAQLLATPFPAPAGHVAGDSSPLPDPAALRRQVTSPGGTTEAAIRHLDGNASTAVIINAVKAARQRAQELGA